LFLVAAVGIFVMQNDETITLQYLGGSVSSPMSLLIGIVYVVGMVTGWTVIGLVQRSLRRVSERPSR
jgi:uncharacterized membrane protein YciS (DUF1049 family)